jgi:hypothetical protein
MDVNLKSACWELIARLDACLGAEVHDMTNTTSWPEPLKQLDCDSKKGLVSDIIYRTTNNNYSFFKTGLTPATEFVVARGLDSSSTFFEWVFRFKDDEKSHVKWQKRERAYSVSFNNVLIKEFDLPDDLSARLKVVQAASRWNIHLIHVLSLAYVVCKLNGYSGITKVGYDTDTYRCGVVFTSFTTTLDIVAQFDSSIEIVGFKLIKYEKKGLNPLNKPLSISGNYFVDFAQFNEFVKQN